MKMTWTSRLAAVAWAILAAGPAHAADADARALLRAAEALQHSGHRHKALELLERARPAAEAGSDRALAAAVQGALGKAYLLSGRRDEARVLLARSLEGARAAGAAAVEAAALNDLGN